MPSDKVLTNVHRHAGREIVTFFTNFYWLYPLPHPIVNGWSRDFPPILPTGEYQALDNRLRFIQLLLAPNPTGYWHFGG